MQEISYEQLQSVDEPYLLLIYKEGSILSAHIAANIIENINTIEKNNNYSLDFYCIERSHNTPVLNEFNIESTPSIVLYDGHSYIIKRNIPGTNELESLISQFVEVGKWN